MEEKDTTGPLLEHTLETATSSISNIHQPPQDHKANILICSSDPDRRQETARILSHSPIPQTSSFIKKKDTKFCELFNLNGGVFKKVITDDDKEVPVHLLIFVFSLNETRHDPHEDEYRQRLFQNIVVGHALNNPLCLEDCDASRVVIDKVQEIRRHSLIIVMDSEDLTQERMEHERINLIQDLPELTKFCERGIFFLGSIKPQRANCYPPQREAELRELTEHVWNQFPEKHLLISPGVLDVRSKTPSLIREIPPSLPINNNLPSNDTKVTKDLPSPSNNNQDNSVPRTFNNSSPSPNTQSLNLVQKFSQLIELCVNYINDLFKIKPKYIRPNKIGLDVMGKDKKVGNSGTGSDVIGTEKTVDSFGTGSDVIGTEKTVDSFGTGSDVTGTEKTVGSSGTDLDVMSTEKTVDGFGTGSDVIGTQKTVNSFGTDSDVIGTEKAVDSSGTGSDVICKEKTVDSSGTGLDVTGSDVMCTEKTVNSSDMKGSDVIDTDKTVDSSGACSDMTDNRVGSSGTGSDVIDNRTSSDLTGNGVGSSGTGSDVIDNRTGSDLTDNGVGSSGTGSDVIGTDKTVDSSGTGSDMTDNGVGSSGTGSDVTVGSGTDTSSTVRLQL